MKSLIKNIIRPAMWAEVRNWLPLCISILAVMISGLQWFDSHRERNLLVRPLITFILNNDTAYDNVGIAIRNNGPGPAVINRITFYVDRKPVKNLDEASDKGNLSPDFIRSAGLTEGDSLGVGETEWLFARQTNSQNELSQFVKFINAHLAVGVIYCSIDSACWEKCSAKDRCQQDSVRN